MRTFSSANAKNRFGDLIDAARIAPVVVTKYDKPFVVVMSADEYEKVYPETGLRGTDRKKRVGRKNKK